VCVCVCVGQRSWVEKFYVLYRASERNAARLDWYDDELSFVTRPAVRKTLFMEEVRRVDRVAPDDSDIRHKYGHVGRCVSLSSHMFQQEAFEKCWAHSPLPAAVTLPFTRCRYCRTPAIAIAQAACDNDNA